ncbi:hypothetical protein EV644_110121 [Kribbella orskensis]|uniref:SAF domain-containing protein n=1 Tax=Kribbella orskensis TaxID=2512216 RepID=A0ABY2BGD8_9ACTN|nr:hypothetical protein EV642_110144 [Kribbella sp. VKM Ac-2500]TCO19473.1 hypothetical protein EV644_110121 [Kribbella orskensis]
MAPRDHYGRAVSFSSSTRPSAAGARGSAKAPGSNRLPAGRERRPALAALAVILILLGAAGSALIALRSGDRQDFVAIDAQSLPPGHKITKGDLARGDLAGATGQLVLWSDLDQIVDHYTTSWLYRGQFVTPESVTKDTKPLIPAAGALVGVSLEAGRAPSEPIAPGDIVQVVQVPAANQAGGVSSVLVAAAEVTSSVGAITDSKTSANTTLNVTILVSTTKSRAVAAAAAAKTLVLVKLSPATEPDLPRTDGAG